MLLEINEKEIRSHVIVDYVLSHYERYENERGLPYIVLFSSGNAYNSLASIYERTVRLKSSNWETPYDIRYNHPYCFDATSGHLSMDLMQKIAIRLHEIYEREIDASGKTIYEIPTGSGETLVCLKMAFPDVSFVAVYDDNSPHTKYEEQAPLNKLVELLAYDIIHIKKEDN